ncbi:hypothetical protein CGCS363_v012288 [Colletotrichum siamense]|uniref:uncharacterized protein n=1 Tax=Colletotrichum siamense TaxID=690259 RepID=UPI001872B8D9|nr:uncharacterized protein CGCS363_v012288 [Colletotrichum siamense]KAF5489658.1 hypothetical protein CGCS363_v012288 [Colletotrichum siamense]
MPSFHMSTQNIKDTLAPRETNGHVVFLKKLHWLKKESQVEAYVDEIIRPRQVEYYWPEKDDRAKKAKQQNMGYVWIRLPLQNRHPTGRPHHTPPINTPSASTALPPASDSHLTSEDPACDTAYMRLSHATTTPGNTPAANFANIKLIMTGDALVDSQPQNEGGGPTGEDSASESAEEDSYSDVESLGLDLS